MPRLTTFREADVRLRDHAQNSYRSQSGVDVAIITRTQTANDCSWRFIVDTPAGQLCYDCLIGIVTSWFVLRYNCQKFTTLGCGSPIECTLSE